MWRADRQADFRSKDDLEVIYLVAAEMRLATDQMFKNIVENNLPVAEDVLREMNRGSWSTGYCGQSPERTVAYGQQADFDMLTQRAGPGRRLLRPALACWDHLKSNTQYAAALQHQPRRGRRWRFPAFRCRTRGETSRRLD
jgi:hypothetical protein